MMTSRGAKEGHVQFYPRNHMLCCVLTLKSSILLCRIFDIDTALVFGYTCLAEQNVGSANPWVEHSGEH
jgi:hypothetical protein